MDFRVSRDNFAALKALIQFISSVYYENQYMHSFREPKINMLYSLTGGRPH